MTFPIRGHSYLECDKNTALVRHSSPAETPQDWVKVFQAARSKPSPFIIEEVDQEIGQTFWMKSTTAKTSMQFKGYKRI